MLAGVPVPRAHRVAALGVAARSASTRRIVTVVRLNSGIAEMGSTSAT